MAKRKIEQNMFGNWCVYYYVDSKDKWFSYQECFKTYEEASEWLDNKIKADLKAQEFNKNLSSKVPDDYYGKKGTYYGD